MTRLVLSLVLGLFCALGQSFYDGEFMSEVWVPDSTRELSAETPVKFIVALKLRDVDHMHNTLQSVSDPTSKSYGKFMSLEEVSAKYGAKKEDRQKVVDFFQNIRDAKVDADHLGDMFEVVAPVSSIHEAMDTKLSWVAHSMGHTEKRAVRAMKPLSIPEELHQHISFISLNVPVNHMAPKAVKSLAQRREKARKAAGVEVKDDYFGNAVFEADQQTIGISPGNEEALAFFKPYCGPTATETNQENPPCKSASAANTPTFVIQVSKHANIQDNTYLISEEPIVYTVPASTVYCYNTFTSDACSGVDGSNCTCIAKLSSLPKYTQLRVNVTSTYSDAAEVQALGASNLFALTDVTTAQFLSDLYKIPQGISVQHGSNQSCAEFYGEFYSNSDLANFFALSGLPSATIPVENVYGNLPNNQSNPGGEAQLDVEYIMALAPNADTFFYSMANLNPYDSANEGFLEYLLTVGNQTNPPLVHSLSYGDQENTVFNSSNPGSINYGNACNQEFMKMGLRGMTLLFSSGDDGIGGYLIRDDPVGACQQALPSWPAGSPYVTAVGGTMLTDKYLPVCAEQYTVSAAYPGMPVSNQLNFQCTGTAETVCSSTFGGVITSGGGFSDVSDRNATAPWQNAAVAKYLSASNAAAYPASAGYFNKQGRAYPDVATYASNYFVYLKGRVTRESGTSASAPVFAAMVTLWNDMRLAYGLPPMGFIAPFLYYIQASHPDAFNDITTGNNACGVGYSIETVNCCDESFAASPGWDAVTGLGSPNFQIIANLVLNNGSAFPNLSPITAFTATVDDDYDSSSDDDTKTISESALGIAIAGLVVGLVAVAIAVFLCCKKAPMSASA